MACSIKVIFASNLFFQLVDFRREQFNRRITLSTHHVVVVATIELMLITRHAIRKRNGRGQSTLCQQLERTVNGGKADLGIFFSDQAKQLVRGEMVTRLKKGAQDGVTLVCMLQTDAFEVF